MSYWAVVWDKVRPRFATFRLRAGGVNLRWAFPLWALEESLVFAVKVSPLAAPLWRRLRAGERVDVSRQVRRVLRALLRDDGKSLLGLPSGEVFLAIHTKDAQIEIGQL